MTNIHFSNFTGSSSGSNKRKVAKLVCSPNAICSNITLDNIDLTSPYGSPPVIICDGIQGDIGVACLPANSTLAANKV
jgi:galacturan 1,4-alpha-galacturonidase